MQLNRVGRLERRARRAPSGKRDLVSHFGGEVDRIVELESASREKKREESRPYYRPCSGTPCINRHLPFNIKRIIFSCMYFYVMWMSVSVLHII
jgi:hypothetical protein